MNNLWRKLDNTAKLFSVEDKKNQNTFRLSVILKDKINPKILTNATNKTLDMYPIYKVKIKNGLFWDYLEKNQKDPIIEEENEMPCKVINLNNNNEYIFKVTYFQNKINLDIFHVLTDGVGATNFLKAILYNYLNLKYNIKEIKQENIEFNQEEYSKNINKKLTIKKKHKKVFSIKEKTDLLKNKTYHYILNLENFKKRCKKYNVSITEYLTALYIYAIYKSVYKKKSNKDIVITVPIDLRKYCHVESYSNFFTCMNVEGNIAKNKKVTFNKILTQVHKEFKNKLTSDNIKKYLARDYKLGNNIAIRLVPLSVKKFIMKYLGSVLNKECTTTLSNIGKIDIEEKYKKYIKNFIALVNAGKNQKIKCTVCSYENNLVVTINSNLTNNIFENKFYNIIKEHIGKFKLESNII